QQLMPRELRHNLGEYYTPDWLAERLLNMLEAGRFEGNPDRRILDPACGSGTFLVLAIKKIREYGWENAIPEDKLLEKILFNVVGFDLNPLAVISARTNYLLALGDLLTHQKSEINIPIYICDSIMTPQEGEDLFGKGILKFNTAVGIFSIPKSLVQARYIDALSNFLEEAVKLSLNKEQFIDKLCQKLPLNPKQDNDDIEIVYGLYEKLLNLEKQGINGIWARIIKNAFAPLFVGEFDYVVGNPPWVNWEHLPENYRNQMIPLYEKVYNLFPIKGFRRRHGSTKIDISTLITYVSLDKYLRRNGKLGFLITQSVFKTNAGKGFRRFLLPRGISVKVVYVDDMVELKPFEGVGNRTSIVILQKGKNTRYPVPYNYWIKKVKGVGIKDDLRLDEVTQIATYKQFYAEPVDANDPTSPWITGRPKAIKAVKKVLGQSDYVAHEGVNSGGANGVYWVEIIDKRPDGLVIISNITEGAKKKVGSIETAIEPDLLYPLLRGRDVKRWKAEQSFWIIVPQAPSSPMHGYPESELKTNSPKTFLYLDRFRKILENRPAYLKYLRNEPFYSLYDIKKYTFAPYKVVWTRIANIQAAVIYEKDGKSIIPQETISLVPFDNKDEAYYFCALINSSPFQYACVSYSQAGGKSMGSPHVLENIRIPKFDPKDKLHLKLAELSEEAHSLARSEDQQSLKKIEEEIDKISAQIWGLTSEELKEIKLSLKEVSKSDK
ncbi:MAG: SAM-dependent methyltransferase, partial [Candidatus Omnitrophica bacterium]|nr:SAM-dependent methyltransferase [Candidatus Omnitrophota bacterium]